MASFYDMILAGKLSGGGGGSSVTVESLSVTTNGTYTAPTGKAYSPVSVNVSGGSDPNHLKTVGDIYMAMGQVDWQSNKAVLTTNNNLNRRTTLMLDGDTPIYYAGTTTLTGFHLIPIPSSSVKVTFKSDIACQFAVREFVGSGGSITSSVATTGWTDASANTGVDVTLTSGTNYLGISIRVNSSSPNFTAETSPRMINIDFS